MKAGIKTTEFWLGVGSQVLTLLAIIGVISMSDKATLEGAVSSTVASVAVIVANVTTVWKYIAGRVEQKKAAAAQAALLAMKSMETGTRPPGVLP